MRNWRSYLGLAGSAKGTASHDWQDNYQGCYQNQQFFIHINVS
jgi:hypothetical protein